MIDINPLPMKISGIPETGFPLLTVVGLLRIIRVKVVALRVADGPSKQGATLVTPHAAWVAPCWLNFVPAILLTRPNLVFWRVLNPAGGWSVCDRSSSCRLRQPLRRGRADEPRLEQIRIQIVYFIKIKYGILLVLVELGEGFHFPLRGREAGTPIASDSRAQVFSADASLQQKCQEKWTKAKYRVLPMNLNAVTLNRLWCASRSRLHWVGDAAQED